MYREIDRWGFAFFLYMYMHIGKEKNGEKREGGRRKEDEIKGETVEDGGKGKGINRGGRRAEARENEVEEENVQKTKMIKRDYFIVLLSFH